MRLTCRHLWSRQYRGPMRLSPKNDCNKKIDALNWPLNDPCFGALNWTQPGVSLFEVKQIGDGSAGLYQRVNWLEPPCADSHSAEALRPEASRVPPTGGCASHEQDL